MKNYTLYHLHSDLSVIDSATKFSKYIEKAKELGMRSIGFSEHGSVFQWVKKKQLCDKEGIKYIHGQEFYITESLDEKVRDNYHCVLISRNWEGVKELNKLSSLAYHRNDNHYYYNPRLSLDELITTSENILVTTACIGGILYKGNDEVKEKFIEFLKSNKSRCFLEIQHHCVIEQSNYNLELLHLSETIGVPLITGTDTHSLDILNHQARQKLQAAKNINYGSEDAWDLTFKTYDELLESYKKQNVLSLDVVLEAINNTNKLADMVEPFEFEYSFKYPKLYPDSNKVFKAKVSKSYKDKGLNLIPGYKERINHEFKGITHNGAVDYLLLQEDITTWCHENDIWQGPSRGSVSGSECAYLLGITEIDSVKWDMNFERFMNPERVSLSDIDIDYPPDRIDEVKQYIFNKENLYCSDILTTNTIALKGAIRDAGRALEIPLTEIMEISNNIEYKESKYREKYPELFKYVDLLNGVITSIGSHPCGSIVSPLPIDEYLGTFTTATSVYPISQVDMKCVDSLNFVKLDILSLDNVQIINDTCKLAGIERLNPDNTDFNIKEVWDSILESNIGVFQWESEYGHSIFKKLFSKETIGKIKAKSSKTNYLDLFSMGNGAIRPAGESYRDKMCQGEFNDNGHFALNDLLEPTLGYLVYQEQIIEFLNKFCGFSMGEADLVRRGFAKKTGTEQYIPKIKSGFIKTMLEKYEVSEEESLVIIDAFLKVIEDASLYLFSLNHSLPYSMIGYMCAYLRYYHTGEFLSVMLNINKDDIDKTAKIVEYAKLKGITIESVKFGKSLADYVYDGKSKTIYKGIESIKFCNAQIAQKLYDLKDNTYSNFASLLPDVLGTGVNSKQLDILIKLNFFIEFGRNKKLLKYVELYNVVGVAKQLSKEKAVKFDINLDILIKHSRQTEKKYILSDNDIILSELWDTIPDESINIMEQIHAEAEYFGYARSINPNIPADYGIVIDLNMKYSPIATIYRVNDGSVEIIKTDKRKHTKNPFQQFDMIKTVTRESRHKKKYIGKDEKGKGVYENLEEEEDILTQWTIVTFD